MKQQSKREARRREVRDTRYIEKSTADFARKWTKADLEKRIVGLEKTVTSQAKTLSALRMETAVANEKLGKYNQLERALSELAHRRVKAHEVLPHQGDMPLFDGNHRRFSEHHDRLKCTTQPQALSAVLEDLLTKSDDLVVSKQEREYFEAVEAEREELLEERVRLAQALGISEYALDRLQWRFS